MRQNNKVRQFMCRKLIILFGVMLFAECILLLIHGSMVRKGVPQIQAAVRREIASLPGSQDSFRSLHLGGLTKTYVAGSGVSMTGYFQFDGDYLSQSCHVYVIWSNADTNAPIDKIEISGTSKKLREIWTRI